ncbi:MAG: hypothetical protein ACK4J0_03305 [Candidatus Anstonellaceae archaeon]
MRFTTLGSKKSPLYKEEYELYRLLLFSINQLLGLINVILFVLKFSQIINVFFSFFISVVYLFFNLYFGLKTNILRQALVFLNIVILQFLFLEIETKKTILFLPKLFFIEIDKPDFVIIFFIVDILLLLVFYYLNVIYPSHRYEKK